MRGKGGDSREMEGRRLKMGRRVRLTVQKRGMEGKGRNGRKL